MNLLYIENKEAEVAVKVNNKPTEIFKIKDTLMQGTVWSSLKCTAVMDKLNKHIMTQQALQYLYKNDPDIAIGVNGMIDDILSISECGTNSIVKNAVINSFIETQRLTLSKDKSQVVHIGQSYKCKEVCPK